MTALLQPNVKIDCIVLFQLPNRSQIRFIALSFVNLHSLLHDWLFLCRYLLPCKWRCEWNEHGHCRTHGQVLFLLVPKGHLFSFDDETKSVSDSVNGALALTEIANLRPYMVIYSFSNGLIFILMNWQRH